MTIPELQEHLRQISILQDAPEDFLEALADQMFPELSREYEEVASQLFQSAVTSSMHGKKKNLAEFQVQLETNFKLPFKCLISAFIFLGCSRIFFSWIVVTRLMSGFNFGAFNFHLQRIKI